MLYRGDSISPGLSTHTRQIDSPSKITIVYAAYIHGGRIGSREHVHDGSDKHRRGGGEAEEEIYVKVKVKECKVKKGMMGSDREAKRDVIER